VIKNLRQLANGGSVIVGHVHTNAIDHGVSGHPVSEMKYRKMANENSVFYGDSELVDFWLSSEEKQAIQPLNSVEKSAECPVVSWIENPPEKVGAPLDHFSGELHLNPMLSETEKGWKINWPTPGYKKEYESEMPYFNKENLDKIDVNELKTASETEKLAYFKQRILLDTPLL
jgi:hypothetical protein